MIVILVFTIVGLLVFIIFGVYPLKKRQRKIYLKQQKGILDFEDFTYSEQVKKDPDLSWIFNYGLKNQYKPIYKDNHYVCKRIYRYPKLHLWV